jgi:putative addiction module killer protein
MYRVQQTASFIAWLDDLDVSPRARVLSRIRRAELGNLGDTKMVGNSVHEMRIDAGPGYRVYFVIRGKDVIVLLAGGNKASQATDIKRAQAMARNL